MKTLATLATLMAFVAPNEARAEMLVPTSDGGVAPLCAVFDCTGDLDHEADLVDESCFAAYAEEGADLATEDVKLFTFFTIEGVTNNMIGPMGMLVIDHTHRGEAILLMIQRDMEIAPTFDHWSWHSRGETIVADAMDLDLAFADFVFNDESEKTQSIEEIPEYVTSPMDAFSSTICANTSSKPQEPPKEEPCWPNDPAITNDEVRKLLEGLTERIRSETSKPTSPKETSRRGGSTFIQDEGRRHAMTSRA